MSDARKICARCNQAKHLFDFGKHKITADGLRTVCKPCNRQSAAEYRAANPEQIKAWREANRESVLTSKSQWAKEHRTQENERQSKWRKQNADHVRAVARARWAKNKERMSAYYADYRKRFEAKHPGLMRHWVQEYRQIKSRACPPWADVDAIKAVYEAAAVWNSIWPDDKVEVDHFIPLRGKSVQGLHVHTNLRIVRWTDNRAKGNKILETAHVTN